MRNASECISYFWNKKSCDCSQKKKLSTWAQLVAAGHKGRCTSGLFFAVRTGSWTKRSARLTNRTFHIIESRHNKELRRVWWSEPTDLTLCMHFLLCCRKKQMMDGNPPSPARTAVPPSCPGRPCCRSLSPSLHSSLRSLCPEVNTSHHIQEASGHVLWAACTYRTYLRDRERKTFGRL